MFMIIGTFYYVLFQFESDRLFTYLAVIPVIGMPFLLEKTKFRLGNRELFCYYLFIFFADFLGCVVNLYNMIWWYDIVVHFCSGIFTFGVGLFLLDRVNIGKNNYGFKLFFSLCFVMLIAGVWELFEFGADSILGMDLQHNADTGVNDTMVDMLVAFLGGVVSIVGYKIVKK